MPNRGTKGIDAKNSNVYTVSFNIQSSDITIKFAHSACAVDAAHALGIAIFACRKQYMCVSIDLESIIVSSPKRR